MERAKIKIESIRERELCLTCRNGRCASTFVPRLDGDVISDVIRVNGAREDRRVTTQGIHVIHAYVVRLQ